MDILGFLPPEISEKILKYLSPNDLLACSLVCSKWGELSSQNRLWKNHCSEIELLDYLPSGDGSGIKLKQLYSEFVENWQTGTYTPYSMEEERVASDILVQGDLIVVMIHGDDDPVYIYRLHPSGPRRIGHIDRASYSYFMLTTLNDSYIAMKADTGIKVYEASKSSCCFHSAYLWRDGDLIVYTKSQESQFNDNLSQVWLDSIGYTYLDGTYIYFQFRQGHRIHAVNLKTLCHTSTEELPNFRLLEHVSPSYGNVYLFNRETKEIRVLDSSLSEKIVLHTEPTVYVNQILKTSDSYIAGLFECQGGGQLLRVWDKFHGNEVLSKTFPEGEVHVDVQGVVEDVVISRDLLFILARKLLKTPNKQYVLSCFSITSGTNLGERDSPRWDTPFSIEEFYSSYGSLYFIKPQFLAVALGDTRSRYIFVFDSVSGKKFYHKKIGTGLFLDNARWFSSKCIVNQTEKELQFYSFIPNKFEQESGQ